MSDDDARERPANHARRVHPEQTAAERARALQGRQPTVPGLLHLDEVEEAEEPAEKPKPKRKK